MQEEQQQQPSPPVKATLAHLFGSYLIYMLLPFTQLFISGKYDWPQAWIYIIYSDILMFCIITYLWFNDQTLLVSRFKLFGNQNQKSWDRPVIQWIVFLWGMHILLIPLDVKYEWTVGYMASPIFEFFGVLLLIPGAYYLFRAFADNTYLSPVVEIQRKRSHKVIQTGVYASVRHPMYFAISAQFLAWGMMAHSVIGLILGAVMTVSLGLRSMREEVDLIRELDGYEEYRMKVRSRILPHIW